MLLYDNRIERRCIEVGLTVKEEKEWDYDDAKVDVDALSESGEESEEHDSDDVCFYSDEDNDDDDDHIGLSFEELKQRQRDQALQQCIDRDGPLAKAMVEMIVLCHFNCIPTVVLYFRSYLVTSLYLTSIPTTSPFRIE